MKKIFSFLLLAAATLCANNVMAAIDIDAENPYVMGFDAETIDALPTGWSTLGTSSDATVQSKSDMTTHDGSARGLMIRVSKGQDCAVVLPEFSDDIHLLTVSFFARIGANSASYSIGYVSEDEYTSLYEFEATTSYAAVTYDFANAGAPEGALIAIQVVSTETQSRKSSLYVDDVTVTTSTPGAEVTCFAPTALAVAGAEDYTSVSFSWTEGGNEGNWQYSLGNEEWFNVINESNLPELTLEGLLAGTEYELIVRAQCGDEDFSAPCQPLTFTTKAVENPSNIVVEVAATTATISWGDAEGVANYQVLVYRDNETADWANAKLVEGATSTIVENLEPNTHYNVTVRSFLSENAVSSGEGAEFRTECAAITVDATTGWSADFENDEKDQVPYCWDVKGDYNVAFGQFDSKVLVMNGTNDEYGYILFPEMNVADWSELQITFAYRAENATYSGTLDFGYYDAENGFQNLISLTALEERTVVDPISLQYLYDGARLAFRYKAAEAAEFAYAVAVDDIVIEAIPACAKPTGVSIVNVEDYMVKFSFNTAATSIVYQIRELGQDWDDEDLPSQGQVVVSGGTLESLDAIVYENTTFELRIKAICDEDNESDWTEPIQFTTPCSAKAFGYEEAFDDEFLPECWAIDEENQHGQYEWGIDNGVVRFTSSNNNFNHSTLISPEITIDGEVPVLLFDVYNTGVENAFLKVEADGITEDLVDLGAIEDETVKLHIFSYYGKNIRFYFYAEGGNASKYITIDNFRVIEKPYEELIPGNIEAVEIYNGVAVTWDRAWDEDSWNVRYKKTSDEEWISVSVLEPYIDINDLEAAVEYELQVSAVFSNDQMSNWSESVTFTPDEEPTAIDNTNADAKAAKRIVNGQLIIVREGVEYNAQGARK